MGALSHTHLGDTPTPPLADAIKVYYNEGHPHAPLADEYKL